MDSRPFRPLPDTPGRISNFFAFQKKRFFSGILLVKTHILQTIFVDFYQNSIFCLPPLRFKYGFQNFWHSINWLLSFSDRSCVPNMIECILPQLHGPLVTCVLFTSLYIFLCKFKSTCKFSFYRHAIMTSRRVTIFFTDSRSS